jgi:hypothetical protein
MHLIRFFFHPQHYVSQHPTVIMIDSIESQAATLDRNEMGRLLVLVELDLQRFSIRNPRHCYFDNAQTHYDVSNLKFPLICKVNQAGQNHAKIEKEPSIGAYYFSRSVIVSNVFVSGGSSAAHKMGIVFNETGLHQFPTPMVAQEFINHNSTLWKVFVVGEHFCAVKKRSVPNISSNRKC